MNICHPEIMTSVITSYCSLNDALPCSWVLLCVLVCTRQNKTKHPTIHGGPRTLTRGVSSHNLMSCLCPRRRVWCSSASCRRAPRSTSPTRTRPSARPSCWRSSPGLRTSATRRAPAPAPAPRLTTSASTSSSTPPHHQRQRQHQHPASPPAQAPARAPASPAPRTCRCAAPSHGCSAFSLSDDGLVHHAVCAGTPRSAARFRTSAPSASGIYPR